MLYLNVWTVCNRTQILVVDCWTMEVKIRVREKREEEETDAGGQEKIL